MPPLTDFSSFFNKPETADVLLQLRVSAEADAGSSGSSARGHGPEPGDGGKGSTGSGDHHGKTKGKPVKAAERTYHLHSLLLVPQSQYFQKLLTHGCPAASGKKRKLAAMQGDDKAGQDQDGPSPPPLSPSAPHTPGAARTRADASGGVGVSSGGDAKITECATNNGVSSSGGGSSGGGPRKITEKVSETELEAMHQLLLLMYSQKVPAGMDPELLVTCLRLADRYQAPHCSELLLTHLAGRGGDALSPSAAMAVLQLSPGLRRYKAYNRLAHSFESRAVAHFRNVLAITQIKKLRQQFCELPFAAVLAWVGSDQLQVHSENDVVYLLSAWVESQQQGSVAPAQLEQLAHHARVLQLGPAYQHFGLPSLPWFRGCSAMAHLPTLLAYKGINSKRVPVYPGPRRRKRDAEAWAWTGPPAWVAGPRCPDLVMGSEVQERSVSWSLHQRDLRRLDAGQDVVSDPTLHFNGFAFCARLRRVPLQGAPSRCTLGMYLQIPSTAIAQGPGTAWPNPSPVTVRRVDFEVMGRSTEAAAGGEVSLVDTCVVPGTPGRGVDDVLERSGRTIQELVAPLLVDGKLDVKVTLAGVDLPA